MALTVFPAPQWPLYPDQFGVRKYGICSNELAVVTNQGTHHVAVAVPTGLFTFARAMEIPLEAEVKLLLMEESEVDTITGEEKSIYIFSMLYGEEGLFDLWQYTRGSVPSWVFNPDYFV